MELVKNLKKTPYGISNYNLFVEENYYYVDKTSFIKNIEDKGRFLFFIRPRRFGKSLFLSTLQCYYDAKWKNRFDFLFKGTDIYKNPTPEKNGYQVLKFDFSAVDTEVSIVEEAFFYHVKNTVNSFLDRYREYPGIDIEMVKRELEPQKRPSILLNTLLSYCRNAGWKIFVIIDEYDNFANTILSTVGEPAYQKMTHGEGFLRAFFNVLKSGTSGPGAPVSRLFMTGVSPITLDDVTSGFNIARNITLDSDINEVLGFTRTDVETMIEYYKQAGKIQHSTAELLDLMGIWYNHYRFSLDAEGELFNPVQVLYFLNNYFIDSRIPRNLVDRNVRIDYYKLRHLIIIDQKNKPQIPKANGNFSKLTEIIEMGSVHSSIERGFPIEQLTSPENFVSLLFYFGLLTIAGVDEENKALLKIPNEAIKRLYYDYIKETHEETGIFSLNMDEYSRLMKEMAFKGHWQPLVTYIAESMETAMGLRDLISREKAIQAFLNVYLGLSSLYIVHSEKELNKGFADLVLEPFLAQYPALEYSYIFEIKYIKSSGNQGNNDEVLTQKIKKLRDQAETQLKQYALEEKFQKTIGKTRLVKIVLIFCGHRLVYSGEVH